MRGITGAARMSSTQWIGASQVIRSWCGGERAARLLGLEVGVLEPGVRERLGDPAVERRVGLDVDDGALVGALEVDRVDRAGLPAAASISSSVQSGVASSLKRSAG